MAGLKDLTVSIEIKNLDTLVDLLQKATDQVEQLEITLKEIEECELVVNGILKFSTAEIINQVKSELDNYFNSLLDV
ncbi:hypothetical protein [Psychrobacillus vulpis]|uniref:Uncharacterized protein n=1 Tax=Psychrobacillus vulpis TaxID=2325572 RepID=A0A544TWK8_9BACI|nr:hypothetical protein [Psychrobacillus vulpis]TQR21829.1 hypothetical protein FG384_02480 [Psychrobacillus vulpis]